MKHFLTVVLGGSIFLAGYLFGSFDKSNLAGAGVPDRIELHPPAVGSQSQPSVYLTPHLVMSDGETVFEGADEGGQPWKIVLVSNGKRTAYLGSAVR